MTSTHSTYHDENAVTAQGKHQEVSMAAPTTRKPLSELAANALASPVKSRSLKGPLEAQTQGQKRSPLKRTSISILDEDKGFQYLKRRKLSVTRGRSPEHVRRPAQDTPTIAPDYTHPLTTHTSDTNTHKSFRPISHHDIPTMPARSSSPSSGDDSSRSRQSNASFTSLINYEPSSQTPRVGYPGQQQNRSVGRAQHPAPISHAHPQASAHTVADAVAGRDDKPSAAETLKLRLRVALYKVMTQQTHVPFARLRMYRTILPGSTPAKKAKAKEARPKAMRTGTELFGPPLRREEVVRPAMARRGSSSGDETIVAAE